MLESRVSVHRGASREDAERSYHAEARQFAAEGYVPTSEGWSSALGQQVLTVQYAHLPDQAPAVLSALAGLESQSAAQPTTPQTPVAEGAVGTTVPRTSASAPKTSSNATAGCLVLIVLVVAGFLLFGRGGSDDKSGGDTGGGGSAPEAPPPKHLTGEFVLWEPVDDAHGYVYFTVTNSGTTTEVAECTIKVENDFGNFGFDYLVGEPVGPGETISGKLPLDVGEGSFLIDRGEVTNC